MSTPAAFSSVVLENVFYSISVAIVVMIGTLAFLLGYRPTNAALTITLAAGRGGHRRRSSAVWWLLRSQPRLLSRFLKHDAVRDAEDRVFRFASARTGTHRTDSLFEFAFHACGRPGDLFPADAAHRTQRPHAADGADSGDSRTAHHRSRSSSCRCDWESIRWDQDRSRKCSASDRRRASRSQRSGQRGACSGRRWA